MVHDSVCSPLTVSGVCADTPSRRIVAERAQTCIINTGCSITSQPPPPFSADFKSVSGSHSIPLGSGGWVKLFKTAHIPKGLDATKLEIDESVKLN